MITITVDEKSGEAMVQTEHGTLRLEKATVSLHASLFPAVAEGDDWTRWRDCIQTGTQMVVVHGIRVR